jgi:nitrite reductase/ring-hydroxylating ferredoxin subunit
MHDTQIATVAELEREKIVGAQVAGVELVAVADEDRVNVFEGRCPHQGTLLSEGYVDNGRLVCRAHGWRFDPASGVKEDDSQTCLHQFSVVVDGEKVLVDQAEVAAWAADEFKPERWLDYSRQDNPHHRKSFLPFGGGPRLCPGRSLALLEIKMAAGMICRHFEVIRAEPDRKIKERFVFTMQPQDLMISLRPRNS